MKVCFYEATHPKNEGSMGAHYVESSARAAGFDVQRVSMNDDTSGFDVELVSVHHCTDFMRLRDAKRKAPIRLVGGHPMANNPRPALPFADAFCVGEGESWVVEALTAVRAGATARDLVHVPGTLVPSLWDGVLPAKREERPLPRHPAYLNRASEGHSAVWYLEMARGCPFSCEYCELGWSLKYRPQDTDFLLEQVDTIDRSKSNKISLFAPDEASHPGYADVLRRIHKRGLVTSFGSMRLDVIVKKDLPLKPNMLIRVGLDGLTEATRKRVRKPIKDEHVVNYFRYMCERGHRNFKVFMVVGYPWETVADFDEWERMMAAVLSIDVPKNTHLRVKFTPFIPQPVTPLGDAGTQYDDLMMDRIRGWFSRHAKPARNPGWYVESDGLMSRRTHELQVRLTQGDESLLVEDRTPVTADMDGFF